MNVLIVGINYAPEPVGIGPYTAGLATSLAAAGHQVTVICARPYYPEWQVDPVFAGRGARRTAEDGVTVVRLPIYVPANPDGKRRLLHYITFAARAQPAVLAEALRRRPHVVMSVAPSLLSSMAARGTARLFGAKLWLHIQDFEVEAAFATGLLPAKGALAKAALHFEDWAMRADRISTISPQMCARLVQRGIPLEKVVELRNWANIDEITPGAGPSPYRAEWGITQRHVAIYSGNLANKQGIEIVVEAARKLRHRRDLVFLVCGNGPNRERFVSSAADLDNIQFRDLQPRERLSDLLSMASVNLLPQIGRVADLVLPSKLTNMLASGRPLVATAEPGTGLAHEVEGCGLITPPGDAAAFAGAIERLIDSPELRAQFGAEARRRAEDRWGSEQILGRFRQQLGELVAG